MTSYESMKSKLQPLGLYAFPGGGVTDSELKAYACGLDPLFDKLTELEREGFVVTAEGYGLRERERFIDREQTALTTEERRERLLNAEKNEAPTLEGFRQMIRYCGIPNVSVIETPARERVNITIHNPFPDGEKALLRKRILQLSPPDLDVIILFAAG